MLDTIQLYEPVPLSELSTIKKLSSFAALPRGWRYGQGGPIAPNIIAAAKYICIYGLSLGLTRSDAFASEDGGILVAFYWRYNARHDIEVYLEADAQHFSLIYERDDETVVSLEDVTLSRVLSELNNISAKIWNTYGSSIQRITIHPLADLEAQHLPSDRTEAYRLFKNSVWTTASLPSANISEGIMGQSRENQWFSGSWMIPYFRQEVA